ncbi:MAG: aminotransferase class I/II-fold pyridoxal phosphate-dependent enzyme [Nitrospinaceae bacterium]|jgi:aspartate aminotransferase|nr:aminotransferase class I/II-fold pyridoxal phosphate-dependent enzyme [Nitrospinaceae bacterium]MBT4095393.1 aminotransferase class I/II-fold pyridoxal phosphate-dependent enzyme [Nitrospinaceae bacterium]MBT5367323.1 aminotransferase class I/II-fold pyridoxal phosphate-dependent enzyme [Nitrospinaceae bacterium]MBT5949124.1 aminotransferase class I/II-fold pyridoxal phosphate-dependent enzyme [Nitrospinaceae bacterium]MBT6393472.1 aminotransferase class I/II-fold pyridoxal phosphate-depende
MVHISKNVQSVAGGERAKYMTTHRPPDMVRLESGTPNFPTPPHINEAAKQALDDGFTFYAPGYGDPEFLKSVCEKMYAETGAEYTPKDVFATNGASSGIYTVMTAFLDPGDEAIFMDPTFSLYLHVVRQLGAKPVLVPHNAEYQLDVEAVRAAITDRTRLVLICNPNNPTGVVYKREDLAALVELCAEKDILLVSDEAYEKILQPGYEHVPLLSFTEHKERLILLNTLSKTYSMTGWRVGYIVTPPELTSLLFGIHRSINGPICSFGQRAGAAALRGSQQCVADMATEYFKRGSLMHKMALDIPGMIPVTPQGGFYLWVRYEFPLTSKEVAQLVWDANVALRSGSEFGATGENHLRFTYSVDESTIEEGMRIVGEVFKQLG